MSAFCIALDNTSNSFFYLTEQGITLNKEGWIHLSLSDFQRWDIENAGSSDRSFMGISKPSISNILQKMSWKNSTQHVIVTNRKKRWSWNMVSKTALEGAFGYEFIRSIFILVVIHLHAS